MNENQIKPKSEIITLGSYLQNEKLSIPEYQRPYKWTIRNVSQLIDDIYTFIDRGAYRIGTIVLHDDDNLFHLVDGQQRTISFLLIFKAIMQYKFNDVQNPDLKALLSEIETKLFNPRFSNETTRYNIFNNYKEIERRIANSDEKFINFFFNKCEITQFILKDVSEAFQFFDSQNSRGKDLEPHDLLKAYHLREFTKEEELNQEVVVKNWELLASNDLTELFAEFLFKVRSWCRGNSARYFSKKDVDLFKGINFNTTKNYPFTNLLKYTNEYTTLKVKSFPFVLDQIIINGKRFFEMIEYYSSLQKEYKLKIKNVNDVSKKIFEAIDCYEGRHRTGDRYVRVLFNCILLYYIDKFGEENLDRIVEKLFVWSYSLRLTYTNLLLASVDNYVLEHNYFKWIKDAYDPKELLKVNIHILSEKDVKATKCDIILDLFESMKYYKKN